MTPEFKMTLETILLTGIGALTTAVVFLFGMIREQSRRCESERRELLKYIIDLAKLLPPEAYSHMRHLPGLEDAKAGERSSDR